MRLGKDEAAPQGSGVSRRQFAAMGVAAAAAAGYSGAAHAALPVQERAVSVNSGAGIANGLLVHPAEGAHPGVVLWSDPAGLRSASSAIARELAAAGFAVLMVDPFVRSGTRLHALEQEHISEDGKNFVTWLDSQDQVASAKQGYVLRTMVPLGGALLGRARGARASYLLATPRGTQAFGAAQQAALDRAITAMDHFATRSA